MRRVLAIAIFLGVALASTTAFAGPWTKSLGSYYAKLGQSLYMANGFTDMEGVFRDSARYRGWTTSLYAEVGVWDRLQVHGYLPFTFAYNVFPDDWRYARGGTGDSMIGLQYSPLKSTPFALKFDAGIPLYDVGSYDGMFEEKFPALGDGQVDLTLGAGYGGSIAAIDSFYALEAGYRHRTEAFIGDGPAAERSYGDGLTWSAQFGHRFLNRPIISATAGGVVPLVGSDDRFTKGYLTTGLSLYVPVAGAFAVEGGVAVTPWSFNSARGMSYSFGLSFNE